MIICQVSFIHLGPLMFICQFFYFFLYLVKPCNSELWQMAISWAIHFGSVLWFYGFIKPQSYGNEYKKEANIVYKTVLLNHVSWCQNIS